MKSKRIYVLNNKHLEPPLYYINIFPNLVTEVNLKLKLNLSLECMVLTKMDGYKPAPVALGSKFSSWMFML